ncbi:MAG: carboxypeptidase regulatory-like domain-containing protein, partial [Alloacidobacterium sp.]
PWAFSTAAAGSTRASIPNYRDTQSNQWNLTVERQLTSNDTLRVSYVGMHSYRLNITEDLNQIPASTTPYQTTAASPYLDPRAPYRNWFTLYSTFNAGPANYEAVEVEATHRMSHGLYFDANYTLAKNLADNQGSTPTAFAGEVNYGIPITNRFDIASDYGNVEGTRRNRFLLTGLYQLPFGTGRTFLNSGGWKNVLRGDWEMNTVTLLETGPWLTPSISTSLDQSNTNVVNRGATLRPDVVSNNSPGDNRGHSISTWQPFLPLRQERDASATLASASFSARAQPPFRRDLQRASPLTEGVKLRFESTFTNVLNHTNFAPPATQIDNTTTFGVLSAPQTAENTGNRTGQVALRIDF